jgi:hypothetical protein
MLPDPPKLYPNRRNRFIFFLCKKIPFCPVIFSGLIAKRQFGKERLKHNLSTYIQDALEQSTKTAVPENETNVALPIWIQH